MGRTRGMADPSSLNQAMSTCLGWSSYEEMMAASAPTASSKSKGKKKKDQ